MRYLSLLVLIFLQCQMLAQNVLNPKEKKVLEQLMERLTETSEQGVDYSDLQTQLEQLILNKLNLNHATEMDLAALFFLSQAEIKALMQHKKMYGPFLSIYELQAVEGLDEQSWMLLSCFVNVTEANQSDYEKPLDMLKKGQHEIIYLHEQEFQKRKGYIHVDANSNSNYLGSPYREVIRYRFAYNKRLVFGYSGEKDMGEQLGSFPLSFFDFNSFYLFYRGKGILKSLAIGDFQANFGKGLTFGSGMAARKSALVLNGGNFYETLRPYRSVNESGFLRGAAVTLNKNNIGLTMFASSKKISSTLVPDSFSADGQSISSIALNGLHRTATEIAKRNNSTQQIAGLNLEYVKSNYRLGLVYIVSQFNIGLGSKYKPYQIFQKPENILQNTGVFAQVQVKNVSVSGEIARSSNNVFAGFGEVLVPLHSKADFMVLYRNYGTGYQTVFANAFSEYGGCSNEKGIYMAFMFKPKSSILISVYADFFESPWLRYLVNAPSQGKEYLINMQYSVSKSMQFEFRYKYEQKPRNFSDEQSKIDYPANRERQQIRFQASYAFNKELTFKTRLEEVFFDKPNEDTKTGSLFFQDVHIKLFHTKLGLTSRLAWFDINTYDARVYATESDVMYNYSIPQFQNLGWRFYVLVHYKVSKKLDVYLKYGQTSYSNINTFGSGLEQINGNKLQELKVQVRVVL